MSKDNGIYILETTEGQCRIIYATAIDRLFDSFDRNESAPADHISPVRAVEFFHDAPITADIKEALCIAGELLAEKKVEHGYVEYGVTLIRSKNSWEALMDKAAKKIPLEKEYLKSQTSAYYKAKLGSIIQLEEKLYA